MIKVIDGDLFSTTAPIICHQVNCQGVMGSGVAKQVREKYPVAYKRYVEACDKNDRRSLLGKVQAVKVASEPDRYIANMFTQFTYGYDGNKYTSVDNLTYAFRIVAFAAKSSGIDTIAAPWKIGCVRGGANWDEVYEILEMIFCKENPDIILELWRLDKG